MSPGRQWLGRAWSWLLWAWDGLRHVLWWQARHLPWVMLGYSGGVFVLAMAAVSVAVFVRWPSGPALVAVAAGVGAWVSLRYAHRAWRVWRGR